MSKIDTTKQNSLWYPYAQMQTLSEPLEIERAEGVYLITKDGKRFIDGISSWWSTIHGYNHPKLNQAVTDQLEKMAHVMLGGISHEPAKALSEALVRVTPDGLNHVFFSDSGSVGCEVALKMALQYWRNQGDRKRTQFMALNRGYHGDTFGAMSVSNPEDECPSMHHVFKGSMPDQIFIPAPRMGFDPDPDLLEEDITILRDHFQRHHQTCAGIILEPIMQGAGGFNFYCSEYLAEIRALCDRYDVLMICDEVATGFGRTGPIFASNHANITPDIMVLGKALTAGYIGHSATLTTTRVYNAFLDDSLEKAFMHGPTFMGNPLACAVALKSIEIFEDEDYLEKIQDIETQLKVRLASIQPPNIYSKRVLGGTGVIQLKDASQLKQITQSCQDQGVFLRGFGNVIYTTPPYIIKDHELNQVLESLEISLKNS